MNYIKSLKLVNFVKFKDVELELGPHPFFILGHNKDEPLQSSNGSGKSLLCEAILWVMFEYMRPGFKVKDSIGPFGDQAYGRLEFVMNGQQIVIERMRSQTTKDCKLIVDGVERTTHKDIVSEIERYIGMSKNTFIMCAFQGLPGKTSIVAQTDTTLKNTVFEILDLGRFADYKKELTTLARRYKEEQVKVSTLVGTTRAEVESLTDSRRDLQARIDGFEEEQKNALMDLDNEILAKKIELEEYSGILEDYDKAVAIVESFGSIEEEIEDSRRKLKESQRELRRYESQLSEKENDFTIAKSKEENIEKRLNNLLSNPSGECNYCGCNISESKKVKEKIIEISNDRKKVVISIAETEAELERVRARVLQASNKLEEAVERHEKLQERYNTYRRSGKKLQALTAQLRACDAIQSEIKSLKEKKITISNNNATHLRERLEIVSKKLKIKREILEEHESDRNKVEKYLDMIDEMKSALDDIRDGVFNQFIVGLEKAINDEFDTISDGAFTCHLEKNKNSLQFLFSLQGNAPMSYHSFSKGEKIRIEQATTNSLLGMMNMPFVIQDETLAQLDSAGIEVILSALLQSNKGRTMLFVSNKVESTHFLNQCSVVDVTKSEGIITAEVRNG